MKPLILISGLPDGGAERITVSFLMRLARRGRAVDLCTVTDRHDGPLADEVRAAALPRHDLGARRLADPFAWRRYLALLRRRRFDVVHAHGQDASILAAAGRRWSRVPVVVSRHVLDEPAGDWRQRLRSGAALRALRRADAVVAVSHATAARLAELTGLSPTTLRVIPNGIDIDRFAAPDLARQRDEVRRRLGHGPEDRLILVPAALRPGKGHDTLLAAFPRLRMRIPGAVLLLAGGGELLRDLEAAAGPFGQRVRLLGPRQDMPQLMAAADVVALPSRSEALPTVLMEASAAGRPIVATRVGGTGEVVEHGRTGLLVPPGDPEALAYAVASLLLDSSEARRLGATAAARARARFSLEDQIDSTLALWARVAGTAS